MAPSMRPLWDQSSQPRSFSRLAVTVCAAPAGGVTVTVNTPGSLPPRQAARPAAPPPASVGTAGVSGGSEVYCIEPNGNPRRVWSHAQDVVYAIAFDAQGRVLVGRRQQGQRIPHRIAHRVYRAAHPAGDADHGVPERAGRTPLRGRRAIPEKCMRSGRKWSTKARIESDVFRRRHVLAVGPAEL